MKALVIIDYTNDFIADDGALTSGKVGQAIEKEVVSLAKKFTDDKEFVVYAVDCHEKNDPFHPESKLFPPHNVKGTNGRQLFGDLAELYRTSKCLETIYWLDKRHYSAFSGTDLDVRLREREVSEVHLVGVCTDICILHTAIDAYNLGYRIVCHERAVASFNLVGHQWALNHFTEALGAQIV